MPSIKITVANPSLSYRLAALILGLAGLGLILQTGLPTAPEFVVALPAGQSIIAPVEGGLVPPFEAIATDGQLLNVGATMGHPLVINFWATWCEPCEAEMPLLQDVFTAGVPVVGIHEGGHNADSVVNWSSRRGLTFPLILDSASRDLEAQYRVRGWPTTFFVDANGVILRVVRGALTPQTLSEGLAALAQEG